MIRVRMSVYQHQRKRSYSLSNRPGIRCIHATIDKSRLGISGKKEKTDHPVLNPPSLIVYLNDFCHNFSPYDNMGAPIGGCATLPGFSGSKAPLKTGGRAFRGSLTLGVLTPKLHRRKPCTLQKSFSGT